MIVKLVGVDKLFVIVMSRIDQNIYKSVSSENRTRINFFTKNADKLYAQAKVVDSKFKDRLATLRAEIEQVCISWTELFPRKCATVVPKKHFPKKSIPQKSIFSITCFSGNN